MRAKRKPPTSTEYTHVGGRDQVGYQHSGSKTFDHQDKPGPGVLHALIRQASTLGSGEYRALCGISVSAYTYDVHNQGERNLYIWAKDKALVTCSFCLARLRKAKEMSE